MNKKTEALKLADWVSDKCRPRVPSIENWLLFKKALAAIREALAQPVKQEPVAWWNGKETAWFEHELCGWQAPDGCTIPLYAAPVDAKAIRAEALQTAFKICTELRSEPDDHKVYEKYEAGYVDACNNCANAILEQLNEL